MGISKIDNICKLNPSIIFLDWFSTAWICIKTNTLYDYLDCIVRKLLIKNNKTQIIFLLFDRKDMTNNRLLMYQYVMEYANKYNFKFIKLYPNENINDLLRDDVHTTELGCKFYGTEIYNYFINNLLSSNSTYIIIYLLKTNMQI